MLCNGIQKPRWGFKTIAKMLKEMALDVDFDTSSITINQIEWQQLNGLTSWEYY